MPMPTPAGVPVVMMSPGSSVMFRLMNSIRYGMSKNWNKNGTRICGIRRSSRPSSRARPMPGIVTGRVSWSCARRFRPYSRSTRSHERWAEQLQVGYFAVLRSGGGPSGDVNAVKALAQSAT